MQCLWQHWQINCKTNNRGVGQHIRHLYLFEKKSNYGNHKLIGIVLDIMSFKLYSLMKRGQAYHMPMEINSGFLAK